MWYARDSHGNERQKMLGLQCLVNFHLHAPTGTLHEAILPCLGELGQSDSVLIRRRVFLQSKKRFPVNSLTQNVESAGQLFLG